MSISQNGILRRALLVIHHVLLAPSNGTPHKLVEIPGAPHDVDRAGERFLSKFDMAFQWTLDTPAER